ncbi:hypothetical protein SNEBB_006102 [Seison nebaliae]|nr:hypothetical protein SNEBB_006102 [Seison nebaliae]
MLTFNSTTEMEVILLSIFIFTFHSITLLDDVPQITGNAVPVNQYPRLYIKIYNYYSTENICQEKSRKFSFSKRHLTCLNTEKNIYQIFRTHVIGEMNDAETETLPDLWTRKPHLLQLDLYKYIIMDFCGSEKKVNLRVIFKKSSTVGYTDWFHLNTLVKTEGPFNGLCPKYGIKMIQKPPFNINNTIFTFNNGSAQLYFKSNDVNYPVEFGIIKGNTGMLPVSYDKPYYIRYICSNQWFFAKFLNIYGLI